MQKNWKKLLLSCMLALAVGLALAGCGDDKAESDDAPKLTCTVEIRCDELVDNEALTNEDILPFIAEDGAILAAAAVEFAEGDTVFDVLKTVTKDNKIPMDFEESSATTFVKGINNIYGGELGDMSGWLYQVNEESPNVGCADYVLQDGDAVVWYYSAGMAE